ncbi:hypothetical protein QTP86_024372, partial [Hemibagrus guttatus]
VAGRTCQEEFSGWTNHDHLFQQVTCKGRDFLLCTRLASRPHGLKGTSSVREEVQIASIMAGHDSGTHHQFTGIAKYFNSYTITGRRNSSNTDPSSSFAGSAA